MNETFYKEFEESDVEWTENHGHDCKFGQPADF